MVVIGKESRSSHYLKKKMESLRVLVFVFVFVE